MTEHLGEVDALLGRFPLQVAIDAATYAPHPGYDRLAGLASSTTSQKTYSG